MKKIKYVFGLVIFALPLKVSAQTNFRIPNPTTYDSLEDLINAATSLIQPLFLITFAAMVLYGAFIWLTSGSDETKVANSKKIIGAAIIGFVIAVLAPTIVNFVANLLGVDGLQFI